MPESEVARVFLISPARADGKRAALLLRRAAKFGLALRLRSAEGAPLGDCYAFMSGLYFRGKLAYARAFARPRAGTPPGLVIAPGRGLLPPESPVSPRDLEGFARVPVDAAEPRYRAPLEAAARALDRALGPR